MNILIVSQYYAPEQFQINEIAPELVRRGHKVTVLTGLPNYPQGEIYPGYENKGGTEEYIDGVRVMRVPLYPRKTGALNMARNYLSFVMEGSRFVKRLNDKYDIVFCYELSPVTQAFPASEVAKKLGIPLFLYCLDIWPDCAQAHVSKGPVYGAIKAISKKAYQQCDFIAVTSRPFIPYLSQVHGIDPSKMAYLPQHADVALLNMDLTAEENHVTDFMYAGNLGLGQRVDVMIKAAAIIKERNDFVVHIVGDGSQKMALEKLTQELNIENHVRFYGNQKRSDMPGYYQKADALLLTLRGDNAVGDTMPGKLQAYMTTGKPVFAAINGAAAEVINESGCGKCVPAGDEEGLAKLMLDYITNPELYSECGQRARSYFQTHFTLKRFCDDLEVMLEKLT